MKKRQNSNDYNVKGGNAAPAGNDLPQQLFVDLGDFDRTGEPDEIFIRTALKGEPFDVCSFSAHETDFPKDYAQEIVRRYNDFPALQEQNKELLEAIIELDKQCVFMHRFGGTAYNGPEASAAENKIKTLISKYK